MNISMILFLIYGGLGYILYFVDDWIYMKRKLRNCKPIIAEIIYFDKVRRERLAIVSYKINDLQQNAVISKAFKDKIGDKIEIVTDGEIAVRKKIELKDNKGVIDATVFLVIMLVVLWYTGPIDELTVALFFWIIWVLMYIIFLPLIYKVGDNYIKEKLGWRK